METTLIINPGSASKKYALFQKGEEIYSVMYEHTKDGYGRCIEINDARTRCETSNEHEYGEALSDMLARAKEDQILENEADITRVGVRIVAPGTFFTTHRVIDGMYMRKLTALINAAPLHIPHTLTEIEKVRSLFPDRRIIGVSDTAFHASMPPHARRYSIPTKEAETFDIYRFGYHGISISSVVRNVGKTTGRIPTRMIVCHVGSGVSVTALKNGRSVDTTMGFAPTSGLMMGARAGEVDPSAFAYLLACEKNNIETTEKILGEQGGLYGVLGSGDLRVALDRMTKGDHEANVGVAMFFNGIRKAIGAMIAVLNGVDMLVLTGTAAERNPVVRTHILRGFEYAGLYFDEAENELRAHTAGILSKSNSDVETRVVHTAELAEIAHVTEVF